MADADRTRANEPAFRTPEMRDRVARLLTLYCKQLEVGYKQGMNEVLAPFLVLGLPEGRAFLAFKRFVALFLPTVFHDEEFHSLQCAFRLFRLLLLYHDPELCNHLDQFAMEPELFATPWFLTLFSRNIPMPLVFRLWDLYLLEEDAPHLNHFVALNVVISQRDAILREDVASLPELLSRLGLATLAEIERAVVGARRLRARTPVSFRNKLHSACYTESVPRNRQWERAAGILRTLEGASCLGIAAEEVVNHLIELQDGAVSKAMAPPPSGENHRARSSGSDADKRHASDLRFFVLDCRDRESFERRHICLSFHIDPTLLTRPEELRETLDGFSAMKDERHFVLVGHEMKAEAGPKSGLRRVAQSFASWIPGKPTQSPAQQQQGAHFDDELQVGTDEEQHQTMFALLLLQFGFRYVSHLTGGFGAFVQEVRRISSAEEEHDAAAAAAAAAATTTTTDSNDDAQFVSLEPQQEEGGCRNLSDRLLSGASDDEESIGGDGNRAASPSLSRLTRMGAWMSGGHDPISQLEESFHRRDAADDALEPKKVDESPTASRSASPVTPSGTGATARLLGAWSKAKKAVSAVSHEMDVAVGAVEGDGDKSDGDTDPTLLESIAREHSEPGTHDFLPLDGQPTGERVEELAHIAQNFLGGEAEEEEVGEVGDSNNRPRKSWTAAAVKVAKRLDGWRLPLPDKSAEEDEKQRSEKVDDAEHSPAANDAGGVAAPSLLSRFGFRRGGKTTNDDAEYNVSIEQWVQGGRGVLFQAERVTGEGDKLRRDVSAFHISISSTHVTTLEEHRRRPGCAKIVGARSLLHLSKITSQKSQGTLTFMWKNDDGTVLGSTDAVDAQIFVVSDARACIELVKRNYKLARALSSGRAVATADESK